MTPTARPEVSASGCERRITRVAIIDDDIGYAQALGELLHLSPQIEIVGIADGVESGWTLINERVADIVLVDVNMPGGGGMAIVDRASASAHPSIVILISANVRPPQRLRGATPFLPKGEIDAARVWAIHRSQYDNPEGDLS